MLLRLSRRSLPVPVPVFVLGWLLSFAFGTLPARGEEPKKPAAAKTTFEEHVAAVFKNRCNGCHNADKQKGGLNLETFSTAMQGGGSGKVIEPGDLDASTLYQLVSHKDEPSMPPNAPKIPEAEIELIKRWIEVGAPETSGSVTLVKARPKFEFKLDPSAMGRPEGPPAMPEGLSVEPAVVAKRPTAIVALAASPWAPLVAVGGHKQVLLYHAVTHHLLGVLPFAEGTVNVLKFSRNGSLLLAGGGRGGQSGLAVVWDVKTGKRAFEVGKEYDAVLAADISADHGLVALGGPSKILRVYNTADGQLAYQSKKHTEWVTAVEFSPDGVLLASGDRNNGLLVWEAGTGREFADLRGHTAAITDVSWRPDSNVFASASEDGTIRLWEMETGRQLKSISAHAGGVASVRYGLDGRLVTTGRDRATRLWDAEGNKVRDFEPFGDLALEAVVTHDNTAVIAGDWSGEVRVWDSKDGRRLANLSANPAPLETRIEQAQRELLAAQAAVKAFEAVRNAPAERAAALARAQAALTEAVQQSERTSQDLAQAMKSAAEVKAEPSVDESAEDLAQARAEAANTLAGLQIRVRKAVELVPVRKTAVDQAGVAKAAADKALAAARPSLEAAMARVKALQAERDALAIDKKTSEAARSAMLGTAGGP
jgi:mono/diheme cytochrome c family protein